MEKIKLTKEEREILLKIYNNNYSENKDDANVVDLLHRKQLVDCVWAMGHIPMSVRLSDFGRSYFHMYPKLKNPSIWDDKKYVISTSIAVATLIILTITLILDINTK